MDAISLLKSEHESIEELFDRVQNTERDEHGQLFAEIKPQLEAHAHIEEAVFYPSLQEEGDQELFELTTKALLEHQQMKTALGELAATLTAAGGWVDEEFDTVLTKMIENVRLHVEEEENTMFPMIEDQFAPEVLEYWGDRMEKEKERFLASAEAVLA